MKKLILLLLATLLCGNAIAAETLVYKLACVDLDENPGICLTHPLDPAQPGRVSISIAWAHHWRWQPLAGNISAAGEFQHGQQWHLLATDGLYRSTDGGKTLEKVLDEKGSAVSRKTEPTAK